MATYALRADRDAIEMECPWEARDLPRSIHDFLGATAAAHGDRPALSFQLLSAPNAPATTLTWRHLRSRVTQAANLFRSLGIGERDVVAYVLPNCPEIAISFLGGTIAGIANPVNPLLEPEQIAAILRETGARVVVTLKPFPKTDIAQKVAEAVRHAPRVHTVLEVDLAGYLTGLKRMIVPLIRPKVQGADHADRVDFAAALAAQPQDRLTFEDPREDRIAACFHTGGTTGMPKIARHRISGMIYNGWLGKRLLFTKEDTLICPLPLFHVFAAYPVMMSVIAAGAHVVLPTPAGFRGPGVFDNFWRLVERWQGSFVAMVPTAAAALMQREINADISSLKLAFSGSAALPVELYNRFEAATGVTICEGYGLTEATCLVSINPPDGAKKIGSVGLPFPYTEVRILHCDTDGNVTRECGPDEIGEICVASPGVVTGATYTDETKNLGLFADGRYVRTGDLGRMDADGYLFITGRAKDVIIRGGHNIDPAEIEQALAGHRDVAFVGAIGQPDAVAGELPCAYVEPVAGATATAEDLMAYARHHIHERAAIPKHVEIVAELPKTAVGKVFKPELRKRAIARVYDAALAEAGLAVHVAEVVEHPQRGLVARLARQSGVHDEAVNHVLGNFTRPWDWAD